jgi:hypothetical protein
MQNDPTMQAVAESLVDGRPADLPVEATGPAQAGTDAAPTYEDLLPFLLLSMAGGY